MSAWLIAVIGVVYLYIGIDFWYQSGFTLSLDYNTGMAITYGGYAIGNIGLFILAYKGFKC